jgi:hypothetical protein
MGGAFLHTQQPFLVVKEIHAHIFVGLETLSRFAKFCDLKVFKVKL